VDSVCLDIILVIASAAFLPGVAHSVIVAWVCLNRHMQRVELEEFFDESAAG
jgi:hypothetical protein